MGTWGLIKEDVRAWKRHGFGRDEDRVRVRDVLILSWRYPGLRATINYRLSHWARHKRIPGLATMLFNRNIRRYGFDMVADVPVGPGLFTPHPVGVVIMAERIGSGATINGSVTIGLRNTYDFPIIEDNVEIGVGARVLGGIRIGAGARIGANAVVTTDVPAGATAVGIPARIIERRIHAQAVAASPDATQVP